MCHDVVQLYSMILLIVPLLCRDQLNYYWMISNKSHLNGIYRETCSVCTKQIYTHDSVLICSLDGRIYHSKCFKIDNSSAKEIRGYSDWYCPLCCKSLFPFYDLDLDIHSNVTHTCCECRKLISPKRDKITHCYVCLKVAHQRCIAHRPCRYCTTSPSEGPYPFSEQVFNPYIQDLSPDKFDFDQDDIEEFCTTLSTASTILNECSIIEPDKLSADFFTNSLNNRKRTSIYWWF